MSSDTPFVEYLIIGTHTSVTILLIVLVIFGIPLVSLVDIDAAAIVLLLPFAYLLGMLVDSLVQYPLEPFRKRIRDQMFKYEEYKDEFIALSSPELYSAYDARVRRVRVLGAAIFNWPFLCIALLLQLGFTITPQTIFVIASSVVLTISSIVTWKSLYSRAYKFRKNACDIIRERESAKDEPNRAGMPNLEADGKRRANVKPSPSKSKA